MKSNSSNYSLSIIAAALLSVSTAFGQTNTTGTNWAVTITAPDPNASETGDPGQFTVSRGTNTIGNVPVFLLISGTAGNGTDYVSITNRVLLAAGATSVSFSIDPIDDGSPEPTESVVVRVILPPTGFFPYSIGSPNTATVTIADNDGFVPSNQPPVVNILQPTNNASFVAPTDILLQASAHDSDGTSVEFFANNQSLGFGSNISPDGAIGTNYFLTWNNVAAGEYDLTAKATDDDGAMRISAARHIFVGTNQPPPGTNQPPVVNILQPTNNSTFRAPTNIFIRASAQDSDGVVVAFEFFADNRSLGFGTATMPGTTALFSVIWSNVPPGGHEITAKATDDDGAMRISAPVHIFVGTNQPPPPTNLPPVVNIVQPTNNAFFPAQSSISLEAVARDSDGVLASVEFFANNQSLGLGSNISPDGSIGTNYFLTWNNASSGSYNLTAKATDDDGAMRISAIVHILVGTNQPPPGSNQPPVVNIVQPTNGARFPAQANIPLRAFAQDADGFVVLVEFFANNRSIGLGRSTNFAGTVGNQFFLTWSNVAPGDYALTAKATDDDGAMRFSQPINIFVGTNQPPTPTNQPPIVNMVQPTNNAFFPAQADIALRAFARDFDGVVESVEFFANNQSLGFGNNISPDGALGTNYFLTWSNVPTGSYDLTAKATDDDGAMRISSARHIFVGTNQPPPNQPPAVRMIIPQNGEQFAAPATIRLAAVAEDHDAFNFVHRVDFFANGTNIGQGVISIIGSAESNTWFFSWMNVLAGEYDLSARATDNFGASAHSLPVHVSVVATNHPPLPTNQLAVVNITATDPTASEGLVMWCSNTVMGVNWMFAANGVVQTNWPCPSGTNTATFMVRRSGSTNHSLRVYYSIGGSASNGVDYSALSGVVTILAGARSAPIVVTPVNDTLPERIETVVLHLIPSQDPQANVPYPYLIGQPAIAAAYITDNDRPPPPCRVLPDGTVHMCAPFTNQCFRVELSTNLVHWAGVCTNRVADGAAHHLDANATNNVRQFFRFVPVPCPPEGQ